MAKVNYEVKILLLDIPGVLPMDTCASNNPGLHKHNYNKI